MNLTEYTDKRADLLNKLNISVNDSPTGIRFFWIDFVTGSNIRSRIHTGIHTHSFYEIQIVFSGNVSYDCGEKELNASEGYAILIPPNAPHRFLDCDENLIKGAIAFSVDFPWFDISSVQIFRLNTLYNDVNYILRYAEEDNMFTSRLVCGRMFEMFYSVCGVLGIDFPGKFEKSLDSRFVVAKKYIESNCHKMINSEDVARECGLSSKQLNRIFRQNAYMSLYEYIVDVRIKKAADMLKNSDLSIKEVGFALGFENESGFASFFKRHLDVSPGVYRRNQMSEN